MENMIGLTVYQQVVQGLWNKISNALKIHLHCGEVLFYMSMFLSMTNPHLVIG